MKYLRYFVELPGQFEAQLQNWLMKGEVSGWSGKRILRLQFSNLSDRERLFLMEQLLSKGGVVEFSAWPESRQVLHVQIGLDVFKELVKEWQKNANLSPQLLVECQNLINLQQPQKYELDCRGKKLLLHKRTHIIGILNVTPDSFYDGGRYHHAEQAVEHGLRLEAEGADVIDVGGESTRPGAQSISVQEELDRVLPVIEALVKNVTVPISIDTYKAPVAEAALQAGAHMVNDISGFHFDLELPEIVAKYQVPVVLMHIKGTPREMQRDPRYLDLLGEVIDYLKEGITRAHRAGVSEEQIVIDPGIGFGKRLHDNYVLLQRLPELQLLRKPILVGPSRKSFIGKVVNRPPEERLWGTAAAVTVAILNGADIIRVHDVAAIKQVAQIADVFVGKNSDWS